MSETPIDLGRMLNPDLFALADTLVSGVDPGRPGEVALADMVRELTKRHKRVVEYLRKSRQEAERQERENGIPDFGRVDNRRA